jgi:uncharacterized protein
MADRLRNATSPYLLQHADNPVDWWPWSDDAFAEAARRNVPVLLSVGYSACHWCHVMAHESFEDGETAALMNEHLVSIKVDREERPDVDSVYMTATQAMTGQGGWPMTAFLTPDREPFYCGTYFPREQFQLLIQAVTRAWQQEPASVTTRAKQIAAALAEHAAPRGGGGDGPGDEQLGQTCQAAVAGLASRFDSVRGGFGGAPKFPPSMVLEFLLRQHERSFVPYERSYGENERSYGQVAGGGGDAGDGGALRMAEATLAAMARGGMYDQLGGGFARYSVDADWVVPHFEKMLYDNALLARAYAHWWRRSGSPLARRVTADTCAWLIRELGTAEGGFAAALDADSEGVEGKFYVWTPDQLIEALGEEDGRRAAEVFEVTRAGTFEHGQSVLQLRADPADQDWLAQVTTRLLDARAQRIRPARDDKVVAAWNGLAIAALAEAGLLLDEPGFIAAARRAATLLADVHLRDGRLARTSRDGVAGPSAGVLDDYGCVADGLLVLAGVTGEARWAQLAGQLLDTALDRFGDQGGGFYDTADDGEALLYRPADPADGPSPSGTFAVAGALLGYAALTGSQRHRGAARAALSPLTAIAGRFPSAAGAGLTVAAALLSGPAEIAVVGPPGDPRTAELHRAALHAAPPGAVLALGDGSAGNGTIPLLAGRGLVNGAPAAYVCREFTCRLPVTSPDELGQVLASGW